MFYRHELVNLEPARSEKEIKQKKNVIFLRKRLASNCFWFIRPVVGCVTFPLLLAISIIPNMWHSCGYVDIDYERQLADQVWEVQLEPARSQTFVL